MLNATLDYLFYPCELKISIKGSAERNMEILRAFIEYHSYEKISDGESKIEFIGSLRRIIGGLSFSKKFCILTKHDDQECHLIIRFKLFRFLVALILSLFALTFVVAAILTGQYGILILIPLIPISFHFGTRVMFWGSILPAYYRLNKFFKEKLFV